LRREDRLGAVKPRGDEQSSVADGGNDARVSFLPRGPGGNVVYSFAEHTICGLASEKLLWHRIERGHEGNSGFASVVVEMKSDS
jgi:hypothetical protein